MQPQAYAKLKEIILGEKPDGISTILIEEETSPRIDIQLRPSSESNRSDIDCTNHSLPDIDPASIAGESYGIHSEASTSFSLPSNVGKSESLMGNSYIIGDASDRSKISNKDLVSQSYSSTSNSTSSTVSTSNDSNYKASQSTIGSGFRGTSSFSIVIPRTRLHNVAYLTDEQLENQINCKHNTNSSQQMKQNETVANPLSHNNV